MMDPQGLCHDDVQTSGKRSKGLLLAKEQNEKSCNGFLLITLFREHCKCTFYMSWVQKKRQKQLLQSSIFKKIFPKH